MTHHHDVPKQTLPQEEQTEFTSTTHQDVGPAVHPSTFGRAVVNHLRVSELPDTETPSEYHLEKVHDELQAARTMLLSLTPDQTMLLEDFCVDTVPRDFHDRKNQKDPDGFWSNWLAETSNEAELTSFMQWHVGWIESQQQDPEVQSSIEVQKELYKLALEHAINSGEWLHPDAAEAIKNIDKVEFFVGDVFDTLMQGSLGYQSRDGINHVVIGAHGDLIPEDDKRQTIIDNVERIGFHESNHAVLGGLGRTWQNEAWTEHIARSLKNGQPDIIHPEHRDDDETVYNDNLVLLNALLNGGDVKVPARLGTKAYSEKYATRAMREYEDALDQAWGKRISGMETVLELMNIRIETHTRRFMFSDKDLTETQAQNRAVKQVTEELTNPNEQWKIFDTHRVSRQRA